MNLSSKWMFRPKTLNFVIFKQYEREIKLHELARGFANVFFSFRGTGRRGMSRQTRDVGFKPPSATTLQMNPT